EKDRNSPPEAQKYNAKTKDPTAMSRSPIKSVERRSEGRRRHLGCIETKSGSVLIVQGSLFPNQVIRLHKNPVPQAQCIVVMAIVIPISKRASLFFQAAGIAPINNITR